MKNKEKVSCTVCQAEIKPTMKWYDYYGKKVCYKCYLRIEREKRKEAERDKSMEIVNRMRRMKFFCPKCKERKNDLGAIFTSVGVMCQKCGTLLIKIIKDDETEYYKPLE